MWSYKVLWKANFHVPGKILGIGRVQRLTSVIQTLMTVVVKHCTMAAAQKATRVHFFCFAVAWLPVKFDKKTLMYTIAFDPSLDIFYFASAAVGQSGYGACNPE